MKALDFTGQVAIVTGGGSPVGLGLQYAKLLAARGAKVAIHGRKPQQVADAVAQLEQEGYTAMPCIADATDRDAVLACVQAVQAEYGRVDILVNNAGSAGPDFWPYTSAEDYETMQAIFNINLKGTLYFMEAVWPLMVAQGSGVIVNASSDSVFGSSPSIGYPASKASVLYVTRIAALVGKAHNIKVNAIAPCASSQMTMMLPDSIFRDKIIADYPPERAAAALVALCHKDNPHNGAFFSIGGGQINRYNFANSQNFSAEDLEDAMESLHKLADPALPLEPVNSTFDDLKRYGFTDEEYKFYGYRD